MPQTTTTTSGSTAGAAAPACPQFRERQLNLATATPLGAGAIAHVIKSRLTKPDIPIAIKALSKVQLLQQNKVASAMNEKKALQQLGPHPFIVRLYGTAQSEDELYFVMEWLPHGDLLQHIRRFALQRQRAYAAALLPEEERSTIDVSKVAPKPIPAEVKALRCLDFQDIQLITAQLVLALARTAEKGIVLRDLKPENIAFDDKYRACLIDFDTVDMEGMSAKPETNNGVALPPEKEPETHSDPNADNASPPNGGGLPHHAKRRITVSEIQEMRKKTASFCGTAQYVSPEMVGECKWSYSSDLWALGAIVYEMMYGVHMFSGLSSFEVLQKVVKGAIQRAATDNAPTNETLVPFPSVAFDGSREDSWTRTKDFIFKLVAIDPRRRLGVHPEHGTFDLEGLRQHPFFEDFALWSVLEEQVAQFRPRHIPLEGEADTSNKDSNNNNNNNTSLSAVEEDTTPSLLEYYKCVPYNDPNYADYVFKATADANPFEQFLKREFEDATGEKLESIDKPDDGGEETKETEKETEEGKPSSSYIVPPESTPAPPPAAGADSTANAQWVFDDKAAEHAGDAGDDSSSSDGDLEIIDDVGMHYPYGPVHPDFQK